MTKINDRAIALVADAAGFDDKNLATAIAVALAESGGDRDAISITNDYGLWQINKRAHAKLFTQYQWNREADNAKMAKAVWDGAGWKAWTVWKTGAYLRYKARAERVAKEYIVNKPPPLPEIPNPLEPLTNLVGFVTNTDNWKRLAYFIFGAILIAIAIWKLSGSPTPSPIKKVNIKRATKIVKGGKR